MVLFAITISTRSPFFTPRNGALPESARASVHATLSIVHAYFAMSPVKLIVIVRSALRGESGFDARNCDSRNKSL